MPHPRDPPFRNSGGVLWVRVTHSPRTQEEALDPRNAPFLRGPPMELSSDPQTYMDIVAIRECSHLLQKELWHSARASKRVLAAVQVLESFCERTEALTDMGWGRPRRSRVKVLLGFNR